MSGLEIPIVNGFLAMLVVGSTLMMWWNRVIMRRARFRGISAISPADRMTPCA